MKKDTKLKIKRISTSPYFSLEFNRLENEALCPFAEMLPSDSDEYPDVIITNTHTKFNSFSEELIDHLKLIIHPNSGYDNIPAEFVRRSKAPIIVGSTIRSQAVAQYILSALFNHFSPIPHHSYWDSDRKWPRRLLSDLKVSLIGHGHIGKILTHTLAPLVKELMIYDPYENMNQLDHKNSDVVILTCGLNTKNKFMINRNFLNQIKEDALIINTARGELIKTDDLINFLMANDNAFAVLDVFEKEPCDLSVFKKLQNIKCTSHIAGVYKNIDLHTIEFETTTLKNFIELTSFDFNNKYQKMILQNKLRNDIGLI